MEWLKNLAEALDYIENHLDKEISYDEIARLACCSSFYFQRIFLYVSGVSLSEYIRRRRMTQAAFELQQTDTKVIDIALKYGYSSPSSFNRAFQRIHGIAPTEAKHTGRPLLAYPSLQFSIQTTGERPMAYQIIRKQALRIVGIRMPMFEDMEENLKIVPEFWKDTLHGNQWNELCSLSNQEPSGLLGISVYENPKEIDYYIGVASDRSTPVGMVDYEIPAATWVVFKNEGYFKEEVQSVFRRFYTEWLMFSGYHYAQLPDIEVYPMNEKEVSKGHSEVWIAICERSDKQCII